jgi:hypothetical protein
MKNLNKFKMWDEWSTMSNKYNYYNNNMKYWRSASLQIDINYLIMVVNSISTEKLISII